MVELQDLGTKVAPIEEEKVIEPSSPDKTEQERTQIIPTTNGSPEKECLSPMKKKPEVYRPDDKYFNGLEEVLAKCFKNRPKFDKVIAMQGQLIFPVYPEAEENQENRVFKAWNKDTFGYLYQGEVNVHGEKDGKGIYIDPGNYLFIGYFKNDSRNGPYAHYYGGGWRTGICKNDNYKGQEITTYLDGSVEEKFHGKRSKQLSANEVMPTNEASDEHEEEEVAGVDDQTLLKGLDTTIAKVFKGNENILKVIEAHGAITVPPRPGCRDGKKAGKRTFQTWKQDQFGYVYQGELNDANERDGAGILIDPQKYIQIGHYIHGDKQGQYLHIHKGGTVTGQCEWDLPVGLEIRNYPDGTKEEIDHANPPPSRFKYSKHNLFLLNSKCENLPKPV